MKGSLIFLSLVLGGMGLFCNAYFYGSFGGANDFSGSYAIIGLAFDLAKFALVPVGVFFFMRAQNLEASLAGGAWTILTLISLVAAFGFLSLKNSEYEATALTQSTAFESAKSQVESANAKVESLSKFANSNANDNALQTKAELEAQLNSLWSAPAQNSLGHKIGMSVQAKLGSCPGRSWYHKTYCPQITILEQKIAQAEGKSGGYEQYLAALAFRDNALKQLTNLNVDMTGSYHPVFENVSTLLSIHPNEAKVVFIATSAFVLELLASLLIFLRSRLSFFPKKRVFEGDAQSVNDDVLNVANTLESPTNSDGVQSVKHGVQNVTSGLKNLFEQVKTDVQNGTLDNPSFKRLRTNYGLKDPQIKEIREMLLNAKTCVRDATGKLIPIR